MGYRSTWSGTIQFGMVVIPVSLIKATSDEQASMHQVHVRDGGRIQYRKVCATCGEEVPQADIGKGAELATGETVALTPEELDALPTAARKTAEIRYFCGASEIEPLAWRSSYFVEPGKGATKAYRLLLDTLEAANKVAVCTLAIRSRESLAIIAPRNGVLTLITMYWPAEVRSPGFAPELAAAPAPADAERKMARQLVDVTTLPFSPDEHTDRYSAAVRQLVDGMQGTAATAASGPAQANDLMATLAASIEAARPAAKTPRKPRAKAGEKAA